MPVCKRGQPQKEGSSELRYYFEDGYLPTALQGVSQHQARPCKHLPTWSGKGAEMHNQEHPENVLPLIKLFGPDSCGSFRPLPEAAPRNRGFAWLSYAHTPPPPRPEDRDFHKLSSLDSSCPFFPCDCCAWGQ